MNDLGKELNNLKREVYDLKHKVQGLESQFLEENAYKVDLWARDEIQKLKRGAPSEER